MNPQFAYTILFVSDMQKSVRFYRDLIGLKIKMESPEWTEFETTGCTLALHKAAAVEPLPAPLKELMPAGHAHTGFTVGDIDTFADKMAEAGVELMRPIKQEDFGRRMGVWRDPDGIPVSVIAA